MSEEHGRSTSGSLAGADPERRRLAESDAGVGWRTWGPYLSERQWGTVREDYSADGEAWDYLPHDHARSRAYRWGEDGLAGLSDDNQRLCFALAFWNGADPILKERIFGLTGPEGNHGEDAKEYWWYRDATPTASWLRWQYVYPQTAYPYDDLVAENRSRGRLDPEYELLDTRIFDEDRYWDITVDYAKAAVDDICARIRVRNAGPAAATLHVLPTLWFRNTWSWAPAGARPSIALEGDVLLARHEELGDLRLAASPGHKPLFCENETNTDRLYNQPGPRYAKDGINDQVVYGRPTVNPGLVGTKAALHYVLEVPPGGVAELRLRLSARAGDLGSGWERVMRDRELEADAFYAPLAAGTSSDQAMVMRQAFAGMIWSKQTYLFDVDRWLQGDPGQPVPPPARLTGRNSEWWHLTARDVISMPDKWEYPWFAAWDLGFQAIAFAHIDAAFAKQQLLLMCREWYMHPNGQLPAYEWNFGDVNPPEHALAALRVFEIDGARDRDFLERIFHKLLINFTWWVNRKDQYGNNLFEGGFLGLDNIGLFDRSQGLPVPGVLEQSDGTAWMAVYCMSLFYIAVILAAEDPTYEDLAVKFVEHYMYIVDAINLNSLWDEEDGFYYDWLHPFTGDRFPIRVRSIVGLLPLMAAAPVPAAVLNGLPEFMDHIRWFLTNRPEHSGALTILETTEGDLPLLSVVGPERLKRVLSAMLDEREFLSTHGIRALTQRLGDEPYSMELGGKTFSIDYEPGESTTSLFGGNSNWRGPIWFPVNYLLLQALRRYASALGPDFKVEHPTGSGRLLSLEEVADDLAMRLISIFLEDSDGKRPVFGKIAKLQGDPAWHDRLFFHEYFHGDTGAGVGASHQTGWTGIVADLIVGLGHRQPDLGRVWGRLAAARSGAQVGSPASHSAGGEFGRASS